MGKWLVSYKYISKKTGSVANSGSIYVEAKDKYEAESKAEAELRRNPRVQGTEGYTIEVKA